MVEITDSNLVSVNIDVPKRNRALTKEESEPTAVVKEEPKTAAPDSVDMSALLPQTASLDQVSAKEYLQLNVFPKLENALNTVSKSNSCNSLLFSCLKRSRRMVSLSGTLSCLQTAMKRKGET